jgi:hypothetical protein
MMPMIATTISSSIRVKPSFFFILFTLISLTALGPKPGGSLPNRRFVHGAYSVWPSRTSTAVPDSIVVDKPSEMSWML